MSSDQQSMREFVARSLRVFKLWKNPSDQVGLGGLSPTVVAARDVVNSPRAVTSHSAQSYFTTFFQEPSHILFRELLTNKWSRDHPVRVMSNPRIHSHWRPLRLLGCQEQRVTFSAHRPWFQALLPRVLKISCLPFFISLENQMQNTNVINILFCKM